jgi:transcription factor SPN1
MAQDSEDEILKELGIDSDDEKPVKSSSVAKHVEESDDASEKRPKGGKPKKARRTHSKAMDGFIVSDDESESDDEPKKKKKKSASANAKPDFEMPDVDAVLKDIFGDSEDEKLAYFSSDEENFSDLSDVDEGVVPRAKNNLKKWVTYYKREMAAAKRGGNRRGRGGKGSDDEMHLGDILPEGTKRRKRPVLDSDEDAPPGPAQERSKKGNGKRMSEEEIKAKCIAFVERMEQACYEDNENNKQRKPALKKLALLEETKQMMLRSEWHEELLNAGVLVTATKWLSPLPDRTLPSVSIRDGIIRSLASFQDITKEMLKASKVGSIVMFLAKNDPEPSLKKAAADLVQQWSRMLSAGSDSWQALSEAERHRATSSERLSDNAQRVLSSQLAFGRRIQGTDPTKKVKGPQFAHQPLVSAMDYVIRPESKIDLSTVVKKSAAPRVFAKPR